jgi:chromosome segregation ATPase
MNNVPESVVSDGSDGFANGLDQFITTGDLTSLRLVAEKDVLGEWGMRAEAIVKLHEKNATLNKEVAGLNKEIATLNEILGNQQAQLKKKEEQLSHTQETKELLTRDNEILEVTLERLRQAMVDLEQGGQ